MTDTQGKIIPTLPEPAWKMLITSFTDKDGKRVRIEGYKMFFNEKLNEEDYLARLAFQRPILQHYIDQGCDIKVEMTLDFMIRLSDGSYVLNR